jgi:hypothetical protein
MGNILAIVINGESQIEYDRNKSLPGQQLKFLDKMDTDMDEGIVLGGVTIESPSELQRAQFVALHLVNAIQDSNQQLASAMCSYLAVRIPELKQVRAKKSSGEVTFDFVFDQDYVRETKVHFVKTRPGNDKLH